MARQDLFTGQAGEHAVISKFLIKGWNVAVPQVDVGDDLLVARQEDAYVPVQVKTARARQQRKSYAGTFRLAVQQIQTPRWPDLVYVFAVYHKARWSDFIVVPRRDLHTLREVDGVGTATGDHLSLRVSFHPDSVRCSGQDWSVFRDQWSAIPDRY